MTTVPNAVDATRPDRPSVLLVDDTADKLLALESALTGLPIDIVTARSGREALRLLLRHDFAVILLDVRMPGMDGFETASLIRQRPRSEHTPIIFITAVGDEVQQVARGYSLKAVDYLLAPVMPEVLRTKVSVFVDLFRMTAEVRRQAESLRLRADQLHRLAAASLGIHAAMSLDRMLAVAAESLREVVGAARGMVRAELEDGPHQAISTSAGVDDDPAVHAEIARQVAATRRPVRLLTGDDGRARATLAAPLTGRDGRHLGFLQATGHDGGFTEEDESLVVQIAQVTSIAIENTLFCEAREANRVKDEFVATVSHELRTPLNAMLSWVWVLRRIDSDPAAATRAIDAIERGIRTQARIVDDLLDISRITSGKMKLELQPVALTAILEAAIESAAVAAEAKDIPIVTAFDPTMGRVLGDASRLQQVVANLLSNAVKFTPRGGRVEVALARVADDVILRISDNGRGIPTAFLPHVFEPFRQADGGPTRRTGGLGLGLAIVRQLVERHGGRVEVTSAGEGHGATFTVLLPAYGPPETNARLPTPAVVQEVAEPEPVALHGHRLLVVEDDAATQEAIAVITRHAGADVRTASSAAEALRIVSSWRPDVILCDLGLPGEDGYTFMRSLRGLPAAIGGGTPAIAFTAYAQASDRVRTLEAGFAAHVPKPVEPGRLLAVLATVLQHAAEPAVEAEPAPVVPPEVRSGA